MHRGQRETAPRCSVGVSFREFLDPFKGGSVAKSILGTLTIDVVYRFTKQIRIVGACRLSAGSEQSFRFWGWVAWVSI